jgi:hypothetical protein
MAETLVDQREVRPVLLISWGLLILIVLRWIWVGGIGDFGWTYESAARIVDGQVYFRDFISTLPPLTSYALAGLLAIFGKAPFLWAVQLYLWWIALYVVGVVLLRRLDVLSGWTLVSLAVAMLACEPAFTLGHSYNYAASALCGISLAALPGAAVAKRHAGKLFVVGICVGLTIVAKQNVGGALLVSIGVVIGLAPTRPSVKATNELSLVSGTFFVLLAFWSLFYFLGAGEEAKQQFLFDASEGKGGFLIVLGRAIPRIVTFDPSMPLRRPLEIILTLMVVVIATITYVSLNRFRFRGVTEVKRPFKAKNGVLIITGIYACLAIASLIPIQLIQMAQAALSNVLPFNLTLQVSYIVFAIGLMFMLGQVLRGQSSIETFEDWLSPLQSLILVTMVVAAPATSGSYYVVFALPIVMPLLAKLLRNVDHAFSRAALVGFGCWISVAGILFPPYAPTFVALRKFSYPLDAYWGAASMQTFYAAISAHVLPLIHARSTFWLIAGGPHAAFGGTDVFNVSSYYVDTYNSRSEQRIVANFQDRKPEYVIIGAYMPAAGAKLLEPTTAREWIAKTHDRIWEDATKDFPSGRFIELWRRKP